MKNFRCMRHIVAVATLLISTTAFCLAQQQIDPQAQPLWFTKGTHWSEWKSIAKFPPLSLRGACGDETKLNGVSEFATFVQIRNGYPHPISMVWAVESYDVKLRRNSFGPYMLEHLQPGDITEAYAVVAGTCAHSDVLYARIKCAARQDQEQSACYQDANGNAFPLRTAGQYLAPSNSPASGRSSGAGKGGRFPAYGYCERTIAGPSQNTTGRAVVSRPFKTRCSYKIMDFTYGVASGECPASIDRLFDSFLAPKSSVVT
jgi:hypothetical protein